MNKKICIVSQTHLAFNPRVVKEANSLQSRGFDVTVLTVFFSEEARLTDEKLNKTGFIYRAAVNLIKNESGAGKTFSYRIGRKFGIKLYEHFHLETPYSIMYGPFDMLREAIACQADLYIGHTEVGLWVCNKLAERGCRVAYDFEDWYSHDYINKSRPVNYLEHLEKLALKNGKYVTCTSMAMANGISDYYKVENKPTVIYNGFSLSEQQQVSDWRGVRNSSKRISFIWFSQTIGSGRGLETIIKALNAIDFNFELHIRGKCTEKYRKDLFNMYEPRKGREFYIHPPVPHQELLPFISENDIGLALEQNFPDNRNLTISNKILQYLQAGLLVITSETEGQKEVARLTNGNVLLFENNSVSSLKEILEEVNNAFLEGKLDREKSIQAYEKHFSWEIQEKELLLLVQQALAQG